MPKKKVTAMQPYFLPPPKTVPYYELTLATYLLMYLKITLLHFSDTVKGFMILLFHLSLSLFPPFSQFEKHPNQV